MSKRLMCVIFLILIIIIVNSCQKSLIKNEIKSADVDSSLFFQPVEIEDPFLDKLEENPNQSFTLKKILFPPPIDEQDLQKYKIIDGYRVQIFAGVDSLNALSNMHIAQNIVTDTIYLFTDKGLFKLQVGDYLYYPQADSIKRIFRQTQFPGAWVVQTNIMITISDSLIDSSGINNSGKYKIQVIATGDENKAKDIINELKTQFNGNAFYERSGNIFKVFVGYFENEDEARNALISIRKGKYPDAWLVY